MRTLPDLKPVPNLLIIEGTTYCNNTCRNCPRGENRIRHQRLRPSRFKMLLQELASAEMKPNLVRFAGFGEPLCWPFLTDAIADLTTLGIRSAVTTNGQLFSRCQPVQLFYAGLSELEISAGDFNPHSYQQATGADAKTRDQAIVAASHAKPADRILNISVIDSPGAEDSINHYRSLKGVDRVFKRQTLRLGQDAYEGNCEGKRWPCPQLWQRLTLTVEGNWRYCCSDWRKKTVLPQEGLVDAWQGPEMTHHRLSHEAGDFEAVPACGDCSIWCTSKWGMDSYYMQTLGKEQQ